MTFRTILEPYVGSTLIRASMLHANECDSCVGIQFDFEEGSFAVMAVSENDSISIENIAREDSTATKCGEVQITYFDAQVSSAFIGQKLVNYWLCENEPNYIDSIDLGFGDLNFPNVKLVCSLSEVLEFSINR